jgi:hypothetical protein
VDSLYLRGSDPPTRQLLIAYAKSFEITRAISFITSFGIPSSLKAFPFESL